MNRFVLSLLPLVIAGFLPLPLGEGRGEGARAVRGADPDIPAAVDPIPQTAAPPIEERPLTAEDRDHWAWRQLSQPPIPAASAAACINPIDRFIAARLDAAGITPLAETNRRTLLRRVTFDLTGLPPTVDEVDRFLNDTSPAAYERVVDRLLASPAFGERQAQHWLDLARYADTDGFEHDKLRPQAWRYRDWVIDALNRDLPYDEFVRRQLAGDEFHPSDPSAAVATGFCLCGPDMPDINSQDERRHAVLNEMTATVGAVFLGLQLGCASCHDHKYDPISQADFYRFRAIFEQGVPLADTPLGRTLAESAEPRPAYFWVRGDFRRRGAEVPPALVRIANPWDAELPSPSAGATANGRRMALADWLARTDHPLALRVIANRLWQFDFGEGLSRTPSDFGTMGDTPVQFELLDWLAAELPRRGFRLKSMHRLQVTSAAYRRAASAATAVATAGGATPETIEHARRLDPDNRLWWRSRRRRLEGEAIRDFLLAATERLSRRAGGPGVMVPLPKELLETTVSADWKPSDDPEDHRKRSIYLFVRRNLRDPLFEVFDRPDTNASCPRRGRSTTAPQALTLLNSPFSLAAARDLAGLAAAQAPGDPRGCVKIAFERSLSRPPDEQELETAVDFLTEQARKLRDLNRPAAELAQPNPMPPAADPHESAALVQLCLALFNLNEFLYLD